jgi:adenylate cyclase
MGIDQPPAATEHDDEWRKYLLEGHPVGRWMRRLFTWMPASPRCNSCKAPFGGAGGKLLGFTGFRPSRKNPKLCSMCCENTPLGGANVEIGVLFADMRGYTTMAERTGPEEVAGILNRFYRTAGGVLFDHDAVIDKLIGDEVMALFIPSHAGKEYVSRMVSAAEKLLTAVGFGSKDGPWLPIGVGLDFGTAWVGNIGFEGVNDFTALGDVVNTAARLQAQAKPGQVVMSERVYESVTDRYPGLVTARFELKGKSEAVAARVLDLAGDPG